MKKHKDKFTKNGEAVAKMAPTNSSENSSWGVPYNKAESDVLSE